MRMPVSCRGAISRESYRGGEASTARMNTPTNAKVQELFITRGHIRFAGLDRSPLAFFLLLFKLCLTVQLLLHGGQRLFQRLRDSAHGRRRLREQRDLLPRNPRHQVSKGEEVRYQLKGTEVARGGTQTT